MLIFLLCTKYGNIISFFKTGRILNRFSKDIGILDENMSEIYNDLFRVILLLQLKTYVFNECF